MSIKKRSKRSKISKRPKRTKKPNRLNRSKKSKISKRSRRNRTIKRRNYSKRIQSGASPSSRTRQKIMGPDHARHVFVVPSDDMFFGDWKRPRDDTENKYLVHIDSDDYGKDITIVIPGDAKKLLDDLGCEPCVGTINIPLKPTLINVSMAQNVSWPPGQYCDITDQVKKLISVKKSDWAVPMGADDTQQALGFPVAKQSWFKWAEYLPLSHSWSPWSKPKDRRENIYKEYLSPRLSAISRKEEALLDDGGNNF